MSAQEAQFRILTQSIFNEKSQFLDVEKAQIEPVLVMVFGLIALSFAPFPFYPPHASQAGPQKTLQICVFATGGFDFNDVSNTLLMTSPCIRLHFGDILTYPTLFGLHFSLSGNFFHDFSEKLLPACIGIQIHIQILI